MSVLDGADAFVPHRSLLFTVAYEMLGSAADAEDVVQETWLRWADVDHTQVHDARAYLVRVATRLALNRLRTLSRRREEYVGEWLPEPLLTAPDVAEDVELADSISLAMLTVLETLQPVERAVFVLREVFDLPYNEIALAVDKSAAAVRQIAKRARDHIAERRPRVAVTVAEQRAAAERFLAAVSGGDMQAMLDVLAPDVVLIADGGGVKQAARHPILGARKVGAFLLGAAGKKIGSLELTTRIIWVNGAPAVRIDLDGQLDTITWFEVEEGQITGIYALRNPEKLARLDSEAALGR